MNPLEVMSASRQRQRAFLERLPTTPAASGPDLAGLQQLSSLCVPLGTNLSKVWQQLQDVRKKQQDRLDENPGCDTGEGEGRLGCSQYVCVWGASKLLAASKPLAGSKLLAASKALAIQLSCNAA